MYILQLVGLPCWCCQNGNIATWKYLFFTLFTIYVSVRWCCVILPVCAGWMLNCCYFVVLLFGGFVCSRIKQAIVSSQMIRNVAEWYSYRAARGVLRLEEVSPFTGLKYYFLKKQWRTESLRIYFDSILGLLYVIGHTWIKNNWILFLYSSCEKHRNT